MFLYLLRYMLLKIYFNGHYRKSSIIYRKKKIEKFIQICSFKPYMNFYEDK